MKVLLLNQIPEVNNKYAFSLARGLKKQGIDIAVCGIETDNICDYKDIKYLPLFYNYSDVKSPLKKIDSYKKSWERILKYCIRDHVEIVHVQWYIFSPIDSFYHKQLQKKGIKVVATIHDLLPFNKKFYDFYYHKKIYQNANGIINQAKCNQKKLIDDFGVEEKYITYIPHGHFMEFAEDISKEESRRYLGLPDNRQIILFFGQIKKVKGLDVLIDAMDKVVKRYPKTLCIIAGKVWKDDFSVYQKQIDRLGLNESIYTDIRFISDEEIKYFYNACDIVAFPYRKIYQSGCVHLAYAYKKPVVATTEGEFLTIIKNNETGLLVPAGDPDSLAAALIKYLDNPEWASFIAEKGYEDILQRLSWENISEQVIEVYNSTFPADISK